MTTLTAPTSPTSAARSRSYALTDSLTMLRRSLRRIIRYPSMTIILLGFPIIFLLLFVYVFGGTLGVGIAAGGISGGGGSARADYVNYVVPAILLMTIMSTAQGTAISVAMDMTAGIIARFRTMAIARNAVLTGHVLASVIQALAGLVVITGLALLVGFRPDADPLGWLAAIGLMALLAFAVVWLCVAMGLASKTVESASNTPTILVLLPFVGSGFVPTDSMPGALRWFAEYQPFTPIIETLRGLLLGGPIGSSGWLAVGWCLLIALAGYLWAKRLFRHKAIG